MNICFVSERFPGEHNQAEFTFVKQLVDAIAQKGHSCFVISPFSVSHYRRLLPFISEYRVGNGFVKVYRPKTVSFSSFRINGFSPNSFFFRIALHSAFKKMHIKPDLIYGHFWSSAYYSFFYAKKHNIPLFVATGESVIDRNIIKSKKINDFCNYVRGVICVSSKNLSESISLGLTSVEKCIVLPNAVDTSLFFKRDKTYCRKVLNFRKDDFIVAFVGGFIERKGPLRVARSICKLGGIKSIFIGKGNQDPQCEGILFKGSLSHDKIPLYLSASDCFVLPTIAEGCCNAIIEALACGLPIISSNMSFNKDILDGSNSILIDPTNVEEISEAILRLKNNPVLLSKLSSGALNKAKSLKIDSRAELVIDFINHMLK